MKTLRIKPILALVCVLVAAPSYGHSGRGGAGLVARPIGPRVIAPFSPHAFVPGFRFIEPRHAFRGGLFFSPFAFGYSYYDPYPYYGAPYYYAPPSYGYYPPSSGYDSGSPYTVYDLSGSSSGRPAVQRAGTYYQLGHNWGQDLRQDIVTWDQFVDYVKTLDKAPQTARDEFRRGFRSAYGTNAEAALDEAWEEAK